MSYLDELADALYAAPVEAWRPDPNQFPIRPDFFGSIEPPTQTSTTEWGVWKVYHYSTCLPDAGFKIHIAPRLEDFDQVLDHALRIASEHNVTLKHLSRREYLWALYSKNAPRGNAGKAIVLFPDGARLESCLRSLLQAIHEFEGPPLPGDHRLGTSILHVRYGAFKLRRSTRYDEDGNPYILGPDGHWRPDLREATPQTRDAPYLPEIFREVESSNGRIPDRYSITSAYTTSPGGGVYRGIDTVAGQPVVVKRGIRHIGIDGAGTDAAQRIAHEASMLRSLGGVPGLRDRVPAVLDSFWVDSSFFLVTTVLPGTSLYEWTASNNPMYAFPNRETSAYHEAARSYADMVASIVEQLEEIIDALLDCGIVHNDIQPSNVLIDDGGRVSLIDFEGATDGRVSGVRGVSWVYGSRRSYGHQADRNAVGKLEAYAYWPPVVAAHLDSAWAIRFYSHMHRYFPHTLQKLAHGTGKHNDGVPQRPPSTRSVERAYAIAVRGFFDTGRGLPFVPRTKSGSPDNRQIASFGKGLLATLVLPPTSQESIEARGQLTQFLANGPSFSLRTHDLGFIDGVGLTAPLLKRLGYDAQAHAWASAYADALREVDFDQVDWNLATGLAGYLCSLVRMRVQGIDALGLDDVLERVVTELEHRAIAVLEANRSDSGVHRALGLMTGASGVAVALHHFQQATGASSSLPRRLIEWELSKYRPVHGALFYVDDSQRYRPYLDRGNAGLIVAATSVLGSPELNDRRWLPVISGLRTGVGVAPGLMTGAAGLLYAATVLHQAQVNPAASSALVQNLRTDLSTMLIPTATGPLPAGHLSRRISLDGAEGAGGAMTAFAGTLDLILSFDSYAASSSLIRERSDA